MKRLSLVVSILFACSVPVFAETYPRPQENSTHVYKQVFENDKVIVNELAFNPGDKAPMHHHAFEHVVYVIEGGELTLTYPNGTSKVVKAAAGQVLWLPSEDHEAVNTGVTRVRVTVTELK